MIATHTPLMGKSNLFKSTLFQSKLSLYTSYVLGAQLPQQDGAGSAFFGTRPSRYYYLRVDAGKKFRLRDLRR